MHSRWRDQLPSLVVLINVSNNETISKYDLQNFLRGPLHVFFTIHLEKIKDLDEICHREKPIKFPREEVSSVSSTALVSVM